MSHEAALPPSHACGLYHRLYLRVLSEQLVCCLNFLTSISSFRKNHASLVCQWWCMSVITDLRGGGRRIRGSTSSSLTEQFQGQSGLNENWSQGNKNLKSPTGLFSLLPFGFQCFVLGDNSKYCSLCCLDTLLWPSLKSHGFHYKHICIDHSFIETSSSPTWQFIGSRPQILWYAGQHPTCPSHAQQHVSDTVKLVTTDQDHLTPLCPNVISLGAL